MNVSVRLRKRMSSQFAVDVAFDASSGVTIVFGESGSGKTTLLRLVSGLIRPDEGRIQIGDRTVLDTVTGANLGPQHRRVGFVFQHLSLFPHITVTENIAYGLWHQPPAERRARTREIAASFRIDHLLGRRPNEISGGERQRVALARSLVTDPDLLLLDEPLSALDRRTQSHIMADLRRWNEARPIPILYVTHSQREVFAMGERVLVLLDGAIVADGTPQQVMEMPWHEYVAQLAGFENVLDVTVLARRPGAGLMVGRLKGTDIDLEMPLADGATGNEVRVAVRAGDILIAIERPYGLSARNVLPGTITSLSRQGSIVNAEVDIGVPVEVHITPAASDELGLLPGRKVWLVVKSHSCRPVSPAV
jgi:molybdate transport system ATP-binding protein